MKKFYIIAMAIIVTGLASCSKDNSVAPSAKATKVVVADRSDVGVGE